MKEQGNTSSRPSFATRAREAVLARILPAPVFVRRDYKRRTGKVLNLKDPKTFNDKIQWLKLYNRDPKLTELVDKYRVKDFVSRTVGPEYVLPTERLYERAEDIKIADLPEKCILKATHGSAWNIMVEDKATADQDYIQKFFKKRLSRNYYMYSKEFAYEGVCPRVLCEKLLLDAQGKVPLDFKVFCFNGVPMFIGVDFDRPHETKRVVYDCDWRRQDFSLTYPPSERSVAKPSCLDKIIEVSACICDVAPFARVDFLIHDHQPYVGEVTLYPGNGMNRFFPEPWNAKLGELLVLSKP
jgi:hypothetical protein